MTGDMNGLDLDLQLIHDHERYPDTLPNTTTVEARVLYMRSFIFENSFFPPSNDKQAPMHNFHVIHSFQGFVLWLFRFYST